MLRMRTLIESITNPCGGTKSAADFSVLPNHLAGPSFHSNIPSASASNSYKALVRTDEHGTKEKSQAKRGLKSWRFFQTQRWVRMWKEWDAENASSAFASQSALASPYFPRSSSSSLYHDLHYLSSLGVPVQFACISNMGPFRCWDKLHHNHYKFCFFHQDFEPPH